MLMDRGLSTIQIHDITNNAGALILQRGKGRIIDGHDRLLHIIDFAQFEISLSIVENIVNEIKNNSSQFTEIIKSKLSEIRSIYSSLNIHGLRNKRAINILGSAVKFITGNLDAEDLKIINSDLSDLKKNGNLYTKQNNRQIKINTKFENRLELINKQIRDQENFIRKIIKQEDSNFSENQKILLTLQLDSFLEKLKSIEYATMLAKVNIINPFILTAREKSIIIKEMLDQGLEVNNLDDASSYLTTTVIHRKSSIIICVNVPKLLPDSFIRITIEPLPRLNKTVKLIHHDVFKDQQRILAITSPCHEINKVTICERGQLVEIKDHLCEAPLLKGKPGQCPLIEKPPKVEIKMIAPGTLLVVNVHQDVNINSTCGINTRPLTGIHLITFHNCSLFVNNQLFENYELWFDHPIIHPIQPGHIGAANIERSINLTELQELHMKNRQHLELVDFKNEVGFTALSSIIILIIVVLVFVVIRYRIIPETENCSGRAILKGGLVKNGLDSSTYVETADSAPSQPSAVGYQGKTADSAPSQPSAIGHQRNAAEASNVTSQPSSLGARLAELGKQAGELGL